jgi:UDP-glucose 4-epimerase
LVIHFAAKKAVGESCHDPFLYYDNNINGTINLLKVMEKFAVKNLIFSSSATVYDAENLLPPFSENDRLKTTNPYGTTKLIIEYLLKDMVQHK